MNNEYYMDDFERLLKEKVDEFRMYPTSRVWFSIYNSLHPGSKWPSASIALLFFVSFILVGNWHVNSINKNNYFVNNASNKNQYQIAHNIIQNSSTAHHTYFASNLNNQNISIFNTVNQNKYSSKNTDPNLINEQKNIVHKLDNEGNLSKNSNIKFNEEYNIENDKEYNLEPKPIDSKALNIFQNLPMLTNNHIDIENQINKINISKANINLSLKNKNEQAASVKNDKLNSKAKSKFEGCYYLTPNLSYRNLSTSNTKIKHVPMPSIEIGAAIKYKISKATKLTGGVQFNYTNYGLKATDVDHTLLSALQLNSSQANVAVNTRSTNYINNVDGKTMLHNKTFQISLPIGLNQKLATFKNLEWYAGLNIQPSYYFNTTTYLLSQNNVEYIKEPFATRKFNLNSSIETFISYKIDDVKIEIGPQFRYQLFSTYKPIYTTNEKLYNIGLKIGIVKNF